MPATTASARQKQNIGRLLRKTADGSIVTEHVHYCTSLWTDVQKIRVTLNTRALPWNSSVVTSAPVSEKTTRNPTGILWLSKRKEQVRLVYKKTFRAGDRGDQSIFKSCYVSWRSLRGRKLPSFFLSNISVRKLARALQTRRKTLAGCKCYCLYMIYSGVASTRSK